MKANDHMPDDPQLHTVLLAYISDYQLLGTATIPHGDQSILRSNLQMASLDHAMWFHKACRLDDWLLFAYDSPRASGARGLARGQVFSADGALVASTAQEGLIRRRRQQRDA
jgi:acyl-CoA thioesterase-2